MVFLKNILIKSRPLLVLFSSFISNIAQAQVTKVPESEGGPFKVVFGLLVVLATIAALAWVMKKLSHSKVGGQTVVRMVGGVSVGTRERIVVVEIGGRWIVVGVAPGRVNGIANLEIGANTPTQFDKSQFEEGTTSAYADANINSDANFEFKQNLTKYEYSESNKTQALANPALTSLLKKLLKNN